MQWLGSPSQPVPRMSQGMVRNAFSRNDKVCFRCKNKGHIAKYCRTDWSSPQSNFCEQRITSRGIREPPFVLGVALQVILPQIALHIMKTAFALGYRRSPLEVIMKASMHKIVRNKEQID